MPRQIIRIAITTTASKLLETSAYRSSYLVQNPDDTAKIYVGDGSDVATTGAKKGFCIFPHGAVGADILTDDPTLPLYGISDTATKEVVIIEYTRITPVPPPDGAPVRDPPFKIPRKTAF